MSTLLKTAKAKSETDKAYGKAFRAELAAFKPMDIDLFWQVLDCLAENIESRLSYGTGVKDGCHNLMCEFVYNNAPRFDEGVWPESALGRWEQMARFYQRYEEVSTALSRKCYELPNLERGDDGYGDLMDSLPLAGKAVFDGIMRDEIANGKQIEKALKSLPLGGFILDGENYICMTFEKTLMKSYLSAARDEDDSDCEREPDPHVVLVAAPARQGASSATGLTISVRGPFNDQFEADKFAKQDGGGTVIKMFRGVVEK